MGTRVRNARMVVNLPVHLKSLDDPQIRGEREISGIGQNEYREILDFDDEALVNAILRRIKITGKEITSTATGLDITILDTDKHQYLITITGTTDGTYTITVNGNDIDFVASGNTAEEIRDGLVAAVNAANDPAFAVAQGTDEIILREPRTTDTLATGVTKTNTGFFTTVTGPGGPDIEVTEEQIGVKTNGTHEILRRTSLTVTAGNFPNDPITDEDIDPVRQYNLKGTKGKCQVVIDLAGADGSTDVTIRLQLWGSALF